MRMKHAAVVEVKQLMLAAALDARDPCADERAELRGLQAAPQRGMQHAHAEDGATARAAAEHLQGSFYFRELGHSSGTVVAPIIAWDRRPDPPRNRVGHLFAEVTILLDGATSVSAAHDVTDGAERAIERDLGTAEGIVTSNRREWMITPRVTGTCVAQHSFYFG
jgi:hypothetical protein